MCVCRRACVRVCVLALVWEAVRGKRSDSISDISFSWVAIYRTTVMTQSASDGEHADTHHQSLASGQVCAFDWVHRHTAWPPNNSIIVWITRVELNNCFAFARVIYGYVLGHRDGRQLCVKAHVIQLYKGCSTKFIIMPFFNILDSRQISTGDLDALLCRYEKSC